MMGVTKNQEKLEQDYKELVSTYHRNKTHYGTLENANIDGSEINRSCGDKVDLHVRITEGIIQKAHFSGDGCSVSQSSAEILCTVVEGKTLTSAKSIAHWFLSLFSEEKVDDIDWDEDLINRLRAYQLLKEYPMRQKCAKMAWEILARLEDH